MGEMGAISIENGNFAPLPKANLRC